MEALDYVEQSTRGLDMIVIESWRVTPQTSRKTQQLDAPFTIGALLWISHRTGVPVRMQQPGQAKSFSTDDKLHAIGWWRGTPGGHANDAVRHGLLALVELGWGLPPNVI